MVSIYNVVIPFSDDKKQLYSENKVSYIFHLGIQRVQCKTIAVIKIWKFLTSPVKRILFSASLSYGFQK